MRLKVFVGGQIPLQYISAPIAWRAHNEILHMPAKVATKIAFSAGPLFCEINVLVGMCVMNGTERTDIAEVQVKRTAVDHSPRYRIRSEEHTSELQSRENL